MESYPHLDPRLRAAADLVHPGAVPADIGTDHAYLAAWLVLSGRVERAVAADIAPLPLETARQTVKKYGLEAKISLLLSDGLEKISADEADTLIIAGMGGQTIIKILKECPWVTHEKYHLILQPMTRAEDLRRYLYGRGFALIEERAVAHRGHMYTVMSVRYRGKVFHICDAFAHMGKVAERKDEEAVDYLRGLERKFRRKRDGLLRSKAGEPDGAALAGCEEVLDALERTLEGFERDADGS